MTSVSCNVFNRLYLPNYGLLVTHEETGVPVKYNEYIANHTFSWALKYYFHVLSVILSTANLYKGESSYKKRFTTFVTFISSVDAAMTVFLAV